MVKSLFHVLATVVFLTGSASAQTDVQKDNAASTSKLDDSQIPEANPARPTITNPAHIPPVGYLQFEQGFLEANDSPKLDRQFSLNQATKLSVHRRLMLQFLSQPLAVSQVSGGRTWDVGDLQAGAQILLINESGLTPTVALGYVRRLRAGSASDLDIGAFSQSALILVSGDIRKYHYDSNLVVSEQISGTIRRAQYGQTISITHDAFSPKLEVTGEFWRFTQPFVSNARHLPRHSSATGLLWAVGYSLRPNLVLDSGFEHGVTSTTTQWQGFAGFTYLFPRRLWKHHDAIKQPPSGHHHHKR